jgi:hypothetical protein
MDETTRTPPPRFDDALEDETAPDASGRTPAEADRPARHGAHRPGLIGQAGMALGRARRGLWRFWARARGWRTCGRWV